MTLIILHADHLILMDQNNTVIPNGAVLVGTDGRIQAVGEANSIIESNHDVVFRIAGLNSRDARNVWRRHFHHLHFTRLDIPYLYGAKQNQPLVGKSTGNCYGFAAQIGHGVYRSTAVHDDGAAISMPEVSEEGLCTKKSD